MESEIYNDFRIESINGTWYVLANSNLRPDMDLKIARVENVQHPKAVATAIAVSLSNNKTLVLVDLV